MPALNPRAPSYEPRNLYTVSICRSEVQTFHQQFAPSFPAQFRPVAHFHPVLLAPPPSAAPFPSHSYYQLIPALPPPHPTGSFIPPPPPPPPEAKVAPATVCHGTHVLVPRVFVTGSRQRRKSKGWVRKARGGERSGNENDGYGHGGGRRSAGVVGENKDGGKWAYAYKYKTVALMKKERDTTVMIKNIPYDYTPTMLVGFMDEFCKSEKRRNKYVSTAYDFLYLPMDFRSNKNKGYAFVNFSHPEAAWNFFKVYDQMKWDPTSLNSKTRHIVRARIQGKEALVNHFQRSHFECETIEFLPRSFDPARDGSGGKVRVTPVGRMVPRRGLTKQ